MTTFTVQEVNEVRFSSKFSQGSRSFRLCEILGCAMSELPTLLAQIDAYVEPVQNGLLTDLVSEEHTESCLDLPYERYESLLNYSEPNDDASYASNVRAAARRIIAAKKEYDSI